MEAASVSQHLAALFESHRIERVMHDEWVTPTGRLPTIRATQYAGEKTGWLDVNVLLRDERQLQEAFADAGSSEDGLQDALRSFTPNPFRVLFSALWGRAEEDQVVVETREIGERRFEVHTGNLGLRDAEGKASPLPTGLFSSIERAIRTEPLDAHLYWFRHFFCTFGNRRTTKALFDNQPWGASMQNLAALGWQDSQGYYSIRNFLILKPLAQTTAPRNPQSVDGGSILVKSPFDRFNPYHTTSTTTILRPLADSAMQMSFSAGKRRHDFQMRRAQDWCIVFSRAGRPPARPWPWPTAGPAR